MDSENTKSVRWELLATVKLDLDLIHVQPKTLHCLLMELWVAGHNKSWCCQLLSIETMLNYIDST